MLLRVLIFMLAGMQIAQRMGWGLVIGTATNQS